MTALGSITCPTPVALAGTGPLPVKVRKPDGEMVGSGVSGSPIAVPAGRYFVSVVMPDGRERGASDIITVESGTENVLEPISVPAIAPAMAGEGAAAAPEGVADRSMSREMAMDAGPAEPAETHATVRMWRGDWFASWDRTAIGAGRQAPDLAAGIGTALTLWETTPTIIGHAAGVDQLLAVRLPAATRYVIVPFDECTACVGETPNPQEIAARLRSGPSGLSVQYRSTVAEEANTLLSFVDNGILTEMRAVSEDMVNQGERAMYGAGGSMLRAVTGAYVLLRANQLDGLDAWLAGLARIAPTLPDIAILRTEMLARQGAHEAALAVLKTAIGGRCPWFRGGLSYMLERVSLYIEVSANAQVPFAIAAEEMPRFDAARDRLDRLMRLLVRGEVFCTFDVPD